VNNFAFSDYSTWRTPGSSPPSPRGPHGGRANIVVEGVRLLGVQVTAHAVLNAAEHGRRRAAGLGAVTDPDLLDRLLDLPAAVPVADAAAWAELQAQPPGIANCEEDAGTVSRLLEPPLAIGEVTVRAADSGELRAVQDASLFAGFTRRSVMAARDFIPDPVMLEAKLCGVGIRDRRGMVMLAAEPPVRAIVDGWAWLLQEKTYSRWLSQQSGDHVLASPFPATGAASVTPEP